MPAYAQQRRTVRPRERAYALAAVVARSGWRSALVLLTRLPRRRQPSGRRRPAADRRSRCPSRRRRRRRPADSRTEAAAPRSRGAKAAPAKLGGSPGPQAGACAAVGDAGRRGQADAPRRRAAARDRPGARYRRGRRHRRQRLWRRRWRHRPRADRRRNHFRATIRATCARRASAGGSAFVFTVEPNGRVGALHGHAVKRRAASSTR